MRFHFTLTFGFVAAAAVLLVSACSSSGSDDPRCVSLCAIKEPSTPNAGDVCSQASADACLQECGARIANTTAPCGDCLLEDADFGTDTSGGGGDCAPSVKCPQGECSESGPGGTCTFCAGDMAAEQDCYVQTHPRREVECTVDFRDPTKCSTLCAAK